MKPRRSFNPKRRLQPRLNDDETIHRMAKLANAASYGGNPEHKRNPGDFGLHPPSLPRQGKSLCDEAEIFTRADAQSLLRKGILRGLVSVQERNGWPQNIWAVTETGAPIEAMLENSDTGTYHGYPMPSNDPLADEVRARWT